MDKVNQQAGFTLLELLVTLLLSTVLMLGISTVYSSISGLVHSSKNLGNAQEVIRYSAEVFSRSLKQTTEPVTVSPNQLSVVQSANAVACDGSRPSEAGGFTEIYTFDENNLKCQINTALVVGTSTTILTGIESISFSESEKLVKISVKPLALTGETTKQIEIDIALSAIILINALGA
ncbi:prepilin-type N-terminal cleavage/methylation domain-containing protein [Psychromonas sp.]|nr:prepilin-type N-terminal cleavage/methylation domain-containing protein [Psychromonas sp.]